MTPEALLRLPLDERAVLEFLSSVAAENNAFITTTPDLLSRLADCSPERFRVLARNLERAGLIGRQKLNRVGTRWIILAKMPDVETQGDLFTIPQCSKPGWQPSSVKQDRALGQYQARSASLVCASNKKDRREKTRVLPESTTATLPILPGPWDASRSASPVPAAALPLIGQAPARKPVVLHFPRDQECNLDWNVWDAQHEPVRDCVVRASLLFGRSAFGVGGTPVKGFDDRLLEHCGDGLYICRVRLSRQVAVGANYVCVIDATRHGARFGFWEEPSSIDP